MSATVRIRKLHAEHRASDDDGLRRCQAVQRQWLDGELEAALDRVAAPDELVLVRRLQADLTLLPTRTDGENARAWGDALAAALDRMLRRAAPDQLLRFAGRRQALQTFVRDAIDGDASRDWAWQRLGLLPVAPGSFSPAQRHGRLLALLADDAEQGVPLLRGLVGTPAWPVLLAGLSDGELRGLTASVLARIAERPSAAFEDAPPWLAELAAAAPVTLPARLQEAWLAASSPVRRLASLRLAHMLAEPALARRGGAAVDAALRERLAAGTAGEDEATTNSSEPDEPAGAADPLPPVARDQQQRGRTGAPQPSQPGTQPRRPAHAPDERAANSEQEAAATPPAAPPAADEAEIHTEWGGLLLLLPLLPACGALALLEDEARWPPGSLRLALHRLALRLLPLAADDAAALAFCGLMPGAEAPAGDSLAPAQAAALDDAAARLAAALAERLPDWRGAGLVERVARRRARVVADPGWFEIVFALRDVSLDLRRAALDLDPGFIPWLGLVLRYRYE